MGYPLPLNPMQILFINIIMDGPPAQSLGVEPVDDDVMNQPPRDTSKSIVSKKIITTVIVSSIIMFIGTLYVFITEMNAAQGVVNERITTITFTTFVFFQVFNALNCRSEKKSVFQLGLFANNAFLFAVGGSVIGQLALIYVPFLRPIFETEALTLNDMVFVTLLTSSVWIVEEVVKYAERTLNP
jgi:Ca2+-transporting ATPase